jgi:hypothetical protein
MKAIELRAIRAVCLSVISACVGVGFAQGPDKLKVATPGLPKPQPLLTCAQTLPDLQKVYPGDLESRRAVYGFRRGKSDADKSTTVTVFSFRYPSLVGVTDQHHPARERDTLYRTIGVSLYKIGDWNNLPKSSEIDFHRKYDYRSYFNGEREVPSYLRKKIAEISNPVTEVGAGLTMYKTGRIDNLFMFHPKGEAWGPYGLPRIGCTQPYPNTTTGYGSCQGFKRIEPDLLIMYSFPTNALPCWKSIESAIHKTILFTQANL